MMALLGGLAVSAAVTLALVCVVVLSAHLSHAADEQEQETNSGNFASAVEK